MATGRSLGAERDPASLTPQRQTPQNGAFEFSGACTGRNGTAQAPRKKSAPIVGAPSYCRGDDNHRLQYNATLLHQGPEKVKPRNAGEGVRGFGAYAVAGQLNYTVVQLSCKRREGFPCAADRFYLSCACGLIDRLSIPVAGCGQVALLGAVAVQRCRNPGAVWQGCTPQQSD